ncbi:Uncharacterized protein APZ42_032015 [Daphnia magna]|uniref:HAT C-terminal dimerisation domain-containing protein n=1 Tax=Daphnia magna TaxID=35525 RepID=A0A164MCK3_9CRUS|nr:Uncharacterized protein APZ42_032015 [Daphnia magna]
MLLEESSGQANEIDILDEPPVQLLTADGIQWQVVDSGNEDEETNPSSPKNPDPPPNTQPIPAFKQNSFPAWRKEFFIDWREGTNGKVHCLCKICRKYFAGSKDAFSNFSLHCERKHLVEWNRFTQRQGPSSHHQQASITAYAKETKINSARQQELDRLLGIPGYKAPTDFTMRRRHLYEEYDRIKSLVIKKLKQSRSITLMIDIWSSKRMCGYIGFSLEGVTFKYEQFTAFLCLRQMTGRHTGEAILAEFEDVLSEWDLNIKTVVRVVTDSGSNMIRAFNLRLFGIQPEENGEVGQVETEPSEEDFAGDEEEMVELVLDSADSDCIVELFQSRNHPAFQALLTADLDEEEEFEEIQTSLDNSYLNIPRATVGVLEGIVESTYQMSSTLRASCKAHDLQLTVKDGLKAVDSPIGAALKHCGAIVNSVRHSVIDTEEVFKSVGFHLVAKNVTRWNSELYSVRSVIKAVDTDPQLQNRLNATTIKHPKLSPLEIKQLKEVVLVLTPFQEATDDFQGDNETIGTVVPAFIDLLNKVTLTIESRGKTELNPVSPFAGKINYCKTFVDALRTSLETRFSSILNDSVYVTGAILDPRFKTNWLSFSQLNQEDVLACVRQEIEHRYNCMRDNESATESAEVGGRSPEISSNAANQLSSAEGPSSIKRRRALYSTLHSRPSRPASAGRSRVLDEFDIYINEPNSPMEHQKNPMDPHSIFVPLRPLKYWEENQHRFRFLAPIARDILGIPATSASIERCFSTALDIFAIKRINMKVELLNMLLFIKRNKNFI